MLGGEGLVPVLRDPSDVILTVGDVQPDSAVAEASDRSSVELEPRDLVFLSVGRIEREETVATGSSGSSSGKAVVLVYPIRPPAGSMIAA